MSEIETELKPTPWYFWVLFAPVAPIVFLFGGLHWVFKWIARRKVFHPKESWIYTWRVNLPNLALTAILVAVWVMMPEGPHYGMAAVIGMNFGIMVMYQVGNASRRFKERLDKAHEEVTHKLYEEAIDAARINAINDYINACLKQKVNPTMENLQQFQAGQHQAYRERNSKS